MDVTAPGALEEHVLEGAALDDQLAHPDVRLHERLVEQLRRPVAEFDPQRVAVDALVAERRRPAASRTATSTSGVTPAPSRCPTAGSATSSCATIRPFDIIAARVQISSTSARRCDDSTIVVPSRDELDEHRPQLVDALRVEAVRRLVEDQHPRRAQQRRREPEPLTHAERVRLHGHGRSTSPRPTRSITSRIRFLRVAFTVSSPAPSKITRFRSPDRYG